MYKKYLNFAFVYTILGMVCGVFFREFTKIMKFTGTTMLSGMHTHYLALGMLFFLIVMLVEKQFTFSQHKSAKAFIWFYNIGLNLTVVMSLIRGILQVLETPLSTGADASISGIAGLGHIMLGVGTILFFVSLKKQCKLSKQ